MIYLYSSGCICTHVFFILYISNSINSSRYSSRVMILKRCRESRKSIECVPDLSRICYTTLYLQLWLFLWQSLPYLIMFIYGSQWPLEVSLSAFLDLDYKHTLFFLIYSIEMFFFIYILTCLRKRMNIVQVQSQIVRFQLKTK